VTPPRPTHLPDLAWIDALPAFTAEDPIRILVSGCLAGLDCWWDRSAFGEYPVSRALLALPNVRAVRFCPEDHAFGSPRELCNIYSGDGFDVLDGRARVLTDAGVDWTEELVRAAGVMLERAREGRVHLALLMDISAACGSQVIYDGRRELKHYRKGPGVAAATLIRAGLPVVSQRDFRTLDRLFAALKAAPPAQSTGLDHHESAWYREYFGE
jgi:uncharacterized protein YbbK (DUF523 family)